MAQKGYKGLSGKSLWVNQHYAKGVEYSNDTHKEGLVRALVNWDINQSGLSLKPRTPLFSALFAIGNLDPISLNSTTYMFNPIQSEDKEFFIEINGARRDIEPIVLFEGAPEDVRTESGIYVVDGDSLKWDGESYRLIGLDAPELYNDDGSDSVLGIASKTALEDLLFEMDAPAGLIRITAKFDKNVEGSFDVYGRRLVWLDVEDVIAETGVQINSQMLYLGFARLFGEYEFIDQWTGSQYPEGVNVTVPAFQFVESSLVYARTQSIAAENGLWAIETEGPVPAVEVSATIPTTHLSLGIYSKDKDAVLTPYQENPTSLKLPTFGLTNESHRINYSKLYIDLDITYGTNINITIKTVVSNNMKSEFNRTSRYDPITKIPSTDSFIFIGEIKQDDVVIYSGMISLRYHVPLEGNLPQFQNWYFEIETFINNVYKIKWESQGSTSPNLLDTSPSVIKSYYGQEAIDAGYTSPKLITVLIKNTKGEIVETIKRGEIYIIEPIIALPPFVADHDNGFDGYGIKWEVWNGSSYEVMDPYNIYADGWRIAWRADGTKIYRGIDNQEDFTNDYGLDNGFQLDHLPSDRYINLGYRYAGPGTYVLETNKLPFHWDPNQIQVQCQITKVKMDDTDVTHLYDSPSYPIEYYKGPHAVITPTEGISTLQLPISIEYGDNEELRPDYQHAQDLLSCPKLVHYDSRLLLYGSARAENIIYMSDVSGNLRYFPGKYALDRFSEKIIYVHVYHDYLIVFTVNNIYLVYPSVLTDEFDNEQEVFVTKLIMSNVTIKEEYINTIQNIGKDIVFLSNSDELRILRPNPYVENEGDLLIGTVSQNVQKLLRNPNQFITRRFQYYDRPIDIFNEEWKPTLETVTHIYNNEIYIYVSVALPQDWDPYMFILIYDMINRRWRIYDTVAMAFPYQIKVFDANEGPYIMCRNHISIDGGATIMLFESLNLWEFDDGYGKLHDSKPSKITTMGAMRVFVFNSALTTDDLAVIETVKIPINAMVDPGYLEITPHLMKRFMQLKFVITNIDAISIPVTLEFAIDGKIRQSANRLRMTQITDINDPNYGKLQTAYSFEPFEVFANESIEDLGISFAEWQLGVSKFGPGNKIEIKMGISGRGKIPSLEIGFKVTGMFELFNYTLVYKEQSGR